MPDDLDTLGSVNSLSDTRASDIPPDLAQRLLPVTNEYFYLPDDLAFRTRRALERVRNMLERYIEAHFLLEGERLDLQGRYEEVPELLLVLPGIDGNVRVADLSGDRRVELVTFEDGRLTVRINRSP